MLICCYFFFPLSLCAQKNTATITGKILDEDDKPLSGVTVQILNVEKNTVSNDSGYFKINVTANKAVALVFNYTGYTTVQKNFYLSANEEETITVKLQRYVKELQGVVVKDERERRQAGLINIDASKAYLVHTRESSKDISRINVNNVSTFERTSRQMRDGSRSH